MQLSKHFLLSEFTYSPTAIAKKIKNEPTQAHLDNIIMLAKNTLEPIREHFKKPIKINSGYRSPALNRAVGGSATSQHCFGQAADIEIAGIPNRELANWIINNLEFDQVILEFYNPKEGANSGWVHVSLKSSGNRREKLIALKDGKTTRYIRVENFD